MGAHTAGHTADPLQKVNLMRRLIGKHTAALSTPSGAPCTLLIVFLRAVPACDDPVDVAQFADFTAGNHFFNFAVKGIGTLVEHHSEHQVRMCSCNGVHFTDFLRVYAGRLFHKRMQSSLQRVYCDDRMQVMRCSDEYGIHLAAGQKLMVVLINGDLIPKRLSGPVKTCGSDIAYRGKTRTGDIACVQPCSVISAHEPCANNAKTNHFHRIPPFYVTRKIKNYFCANKL